MQIVLFFVPAFFKDKYNHCAAIRELLIQAGLIPESVSVHIHLHCRQTILVLHKPAIKKEINVVIPIVFIK